MAITQDGNSFTWTGTVTLTNGTDLSTGVAVLVLTPNGGVGTLPVLADGPPGLPPTLRNVVINQVAYGVSLPAPSWTLVTPGGPGVASVYDLTFSVNAGQQGPAGTTTIGAATDLEGGPPSSTTDGFTIKWVNSDAKFKLVAQLCGDTYNVVSFTPASGNTAGQVLASITIPQQSFAWRPEVSGFAIPTGTANTHVDLICRLNSSTTGDQVGYGPGITGAGSGSIPAYPVTLVRAFGAAIGSGTYGKVSAGQSANLYFMTNQTAFTSDAYSVPANTCSFSVKVDPVPNTN